MPAPTYSEIQTKYSLLKNIALRKVVNGSVSEDEIVAGTLWQDSPILIMVVRRPGCQFCRAEASKLKADREQIEGRLKVKMVAVVHEVDGAQTFNDGWWKGDLYFDEEKAFYKALGGGDLQWRSPLRLLTPTGLKTITNSFLNGERGNLKGEGRIMGGLYVLHKGDQGVAYEHLEQTFGDHAPLADVLGACRLVSKYAGVDSPTQTAVSEPLPTSKL